MKNRGYKYLAAGAGLMLITGFILPWLGRSPFYLSGFSLAMHGYWFLYILPLSGMSVLYCVLTEKKQNPVYMLYPGMAGLTVLIFLISSVCFNDSGPVFIDLSGRLKECVRFTQGSKLVMFDLFKDLGTGMFLSFTGIVFFWVLPFVFSTKLRDRTDVHPGSYKTVIREHGVMTVYRRFGLMLVFTAVLGITYSLCDINPLKLWENRNHAREYLFGRTLSKADIDYINRQADRAPQIEAAGKAEDYMSGKYRKTAFADQPGPEQKARERKELTRSFLARMSRKEKEQLRQEARKNALKEKKGGYFPPETSFVKIKGYMIALAETVAIAIWGTLLALICAVPVSFFAAKNTLKLIIPSNDMKSRSLRAAVSFSVRRFLDSCRGFNEFVMALIFVAVIGLGPYAGVLALWIHTFGILGKVFSEQVEAIESGQVEALVSTGANPVQIIAFSVIPQVLSVFVSYTLLRFESNVRSAAILGFVGAGGIGFLIFDKLNGYLFREVCTMMIIIIITVGLIDHLCSRIRMKFI